MEIYEIVTYYILLGIISSAMRVVTTSNVIHAAIYIVFSLALSAILFLILYGRLEPVSSVSCWAAFNLALLQ